MLNTPALHIRNLKFQYPNSPHAPTPSNWVVNIPDFQLAPAEQALLTGGSGSGKSTLLQLIAGLLDIQLGSIEVAGVSLASLSRAKRDLHRGQTTGMIFQTFNLLHGFSACENVMAALMFSTLPPAQHRATALQLLSHLGIDNPNAKPDQLSVGQQQRVAVARAIACKPALILADEPTASLDPENAGGAMDLIQQTCREIGAALLCVSHDPAMASRFDRRVALHELSSAHTNANESPAIGQGAAR